MYRILSSLLVLSALSFGLAACDQTPTTTTDPNNYDDLTRAAAGRSTTADPKIVYESSGGGAYTIGVMDSNGSNQTVVYTTSSTPVYNPNWSPSNSIIWVERTSSSTELRTAEINVGSNGVPVASNVRTIFSTPGIFKSAWSSTSSVNKIAFTLHPIGSTGPDYVCTISPSGSALDTLYQAPSGVSVHGVSWNPDDSKLAVFLHTSSWNSFIVINTSTKVVTDSISVGLVGSNFGGTNVINGKYTFEWSRVGAMNKLAFVSQGKISYVTPTSGSTPTTNNVEWPMSVTWSPNNTSLMFTHSYPNGTYAVKKNKALSTTVSNIDKSITYPMWMNWHR